MILLEDEASLYLQATTKRVWAPRRQTPVARVDPGRDKVNFYGSLNPLTGQEIVMRSDVMNSETTAHYLEQILDSVPDVPILVLWDRAPWHRGQPVRDVLIANPRLQTMLLPTASPELNPQEHVWKEARKAVSHNHITVRFPDLADNFESHLCQTTFSSSFLDKYGYNYIRPIFN